MRIFVLLCLLFVSIFRGVFAQEINTFSKEFYLSENLVNANVGITVYDLDKDTLFFNYQSNKKLIPASNLKIITNYAALKYLPDELEIFSYYENKDTLFLLPSADPTFLHRAFDCNKVLSFLQQVKYKVIVINTYQWDDFKYSAGWSWDDYDANFMMEKTIMPIWTNSIFIDFDSTSNDKLTVTPSFLLSKYVKFNLCDPIVKERNFIIKRGLDNNNFYLSRSNKTFSEGFYPVVTKDTEFIKHALYYLTSKNIQFINTSITNLQAYKSFTSSPKLKALKIMMAESNNAFAEQLLLMMSKQRFGHMNAKKMITDIYDSLFTDIPYSNKWVDGSGLSRYNLLSTNDLIFILNKTYRDFGWSAIAASFASSDQGTLKDYFLPYFNNLYAKTGSMNGVASLSGFFSAGNGRNYSFSVIANGFQVSSIVVQRDIEVLITRIIESLK